MRSQPGRCPYVETVRGLSLADDGEDETAKTLENGVWTVCLALTVETLKTLKEKTLKDKKSRH